MIPERDECVGWTDGPDHFAFGVEIIDVRAILIANPEGTVVAKEYSFTVDGDAIATLALASKAIASVRDTWKRERNARELQIWTSDIGVQTTSRCSRWVSEQDGVQVIQFEV